MATIAPLRALRYNPAVVADLSAVTAPPYDVIGEALHAELLAEPHNIVHLDFNQWPLDPAPHDDRYARAAATLAQWRADGVLMTEPAPALYLYEQTYTWEGASHTRRSMLARVRLEALGSGHIHPHERTFSGPKEDRFQLTVATKVMLSQHLGIFPDDDNVVIATLAAAAAGREPDMVATGRDGVLNRMWVVTDPAAIAAVTALMAERDVFIADGHHRYETMLRYREHLAAQCGGELPADHPAQFTTFVLVGSGDDGLCVMPTHRVFSGWPGVSASRVAELLHADFEAVATEELGRADLGVRAGGESVVLRARAHATDSPALAALAPSVRRLNVALLHELALPTLRAALGEPATAYVHTEQEAIGLLDAGAHCAALLRATDLRDVLDVALAHELMPQKSTYFYPKVLTGLVMYPLA